MENYTYHIEIGVNLLNTSEPTADKVKEAMKHFVIANQKVDYEDNVYGKPRTLFYLSLGNFIIRNFELSYKLALKANQKIEYAMKNAPIQTKDLRQRLGGDDIDYIINQLETDFKNDISSKNIKNDEFDENELDFSNF